MSSQTLSVVIASTQSVAKVFVIGAVGFAAVRFPRVEPFLPAAAVSTVARFAFHTLLLSLIYSTNAKSVNRESLEDYWIIFLSAFLVLGLSYVVGTVIGKLFCIPSTPDFVALRVSATFPNIVALPILIFPSLCEYAVVYEDLLNPSPNDDDDTDVAQKRAQCTATANTMIFVYFFGWSLLFWSVGHYQLMAAAQEKAQLMKGGVAAAIEGEQIDDDDDDHDHVGRDDGDGLANQGSSSSSSVKSPVMQPDSIPDELREEASSSVTSAPPSASATTTTTATVTAAAATKTSIIDHDNEELDGMMISSDDTPSHGNITSPPQLPKAPPTLLESIQKALMQTFTSPGFLAMIAGIVTGFIPPLKEALFEPGGALRFLGDSIETMGSASSSISTMVVAASLAPPSHNDRDRRNNAASSLPEAAPGGPRNPLRPDENPIMSDPNFGPRRHQLLPQRRRSSFIMLQNWSASVRRSSASLLIQAYPSLEQRKLLMWFTLSRLIVTPALVVAIVAFIDTQLWQIPPLAQVVIVVNSALPGALIVVVLLKSQPSLSDTAAVVAQIYLPTYLLSIITIAAWTSVGMWMALPKD